jgi:DNA-binding transcriptional LysR family regulator
MRRAALPDVSARQLEAVLALVEYGSFIAAAAYLRLSQPALTRIVKRLEASLGVRLFERSTRRVQVTAAGREFAAVAERMLADLGITVRSVREVAQERRGLVVLSSVMSVAGAALPRLIAAYRADRPGVEIHVRESAAAHVLQHRAVHALPTDSRTRRTIDATGAPHRADRAPRARTDAGRVGLPCPAAA